MYFRPGTSRSGDMYDALQGIVTVTSDYFTCYLPITEKEI